MARNVMELFRHELADVYDAEKKLFDALDDMASQVTDPDLAEGFREHRMVTRGHVDRLERIFDMIDVRPTREKCIGVDGLINEFKTTVRKEKPQGDILNMVATGAGLKAEHYEMAAYDSLIGLARAAGVGDAIPHLQQTKREEEETAQQLERMADRIVVRIGGDGTIRDRMRQGAYVAVGAADRTAEVVRDRASDVFEGISEAAGRILDESERRGRKKLGTGRAGTTRRKATGTRSTSGRKTTRARTTTRTTTTGPRKAKTTARKAATRARTTTTKKARGTAARSRTSSTRRTPSRKGSSRART